MDDGKPGESDEGLFQLGHVSGVYGVKGWVKVYSDTRPKENIFTYSPWWVQVKGSWQQITVVKGREQGKGLVAELEGIGDRDRALSLINSRICVEREQLPSLDDDEYYWADLIGSEVIDQTGKSFGKVTELMETGGHDVLVVEQAGEQLLIPFVKDVYILNVDLVLKQITVDWEQDN